MKKRFNIFLALVLFAACVQLNAPLYAQDSEEVSQVLLPVDVYVGDHAEIRYTFRSAIDFFAGSKDTERAELENPFKGLEENFSVVKAELYRDNMQYTLRFVIVPWKTGTISFPSFNLNTALGIAPALPAVNNDDLQISEMPEFFVALYPIQVKSIVEKTGNHSMMPPVPPMIIPGTTYVLFLLILLFVVFLILFFRVLLKFNTIRRKWNLYLKKRAYKKNAEDAIKKIKKLIKNSKATDIEFCSSLQLITRNYLEFRFGYRFSAISSSGVRSVFEQICVGEMSSEVSYAVEDLTAMFVRTDYIRYAHDSIDSQLYPPTEHQAMLAKNERKSLSDVILKAISVFESNDEQGEE
ncbi:hypothetical protein [Treponema sp.]|uniref:hypothetical protein n=1 Tax=Treponema sp. TaxID=166 RepID=UPI00298E6EDE|nr:hypothetical protein [Treponema sp.]MCR5613807.1 hypothetical protein [Treponema sp.]